MKKVQRIALVNLLLFILNSIFVHAALLSPVTSRLRYVFFNMSGTAAFSVWLKFAFFVIVFAILYNAGLRAFKSAEAPMKRALAVLTFVIALTSAIFIPYKLLLYIFKTYYVILVVLFALLPALIGFILCNKVLHGEDRWHRFMRAIIYILITIFIFGLIGQVEAKSSPDTKLFMQVLEPLMWGAIIALIAGFWNLLMALGGDTVASHVPQMLGGTRGAPPAPAHGATPAGPAHPGTPAPGAPAPPAPGAPPAGPPPQHLLDEIQNFVQVVGHPPGTLSPARTGLCQASEREGRYCYDNITHVPDPVTRHNNAVQFMNPVNALRTELANQRTRMEAILTHASYGAVPPNYRQAFEQAVAFFLNIEYNFTVIYLETIPWI